MRPRCRVRVPCARPRRRFVVQRCRVVTGQRIVAVDDVDSCSSSSTPADAVPSADHLHGCPTTCRQRHRSDSNTAYGRYYACINYFRARRYASAIIARPIALCLSVCSSQAGIVSKRLDGSSSFLAQRLPPAYHTPCFKGIWVSPKIRVV